MTANKPPALPPAPPPAPMPESVSAPVGWLYPPAASQYISAIEATEVRNSIPAKLLGRLLYQESRYRADIISGATVSSAGAVGIAQIVPKWHPTVNPLDPYASIRYAGLYLRENYERFGQWNMALAAYNYGPTRLAREVGSPNWLARLPRETQNYVREITADVPTGEQL